MSLPKISSRRSAAFQSEKLPPGIVVVLRSFRVLVARLHSAHASHVAEPETLLRRHRTAFVCSGARSRGAGRPALSAYIRSLVQRIGRTLCSDAPVGNVETVVRRTGTTRRIQRRSGDCLFSLLRPDEDEGERGKTPVRWSIANRRAIMDNLSLRRYCAVQDHWPSSSRIATFGSLFTGGRRRWAEILGTRFHRWLSSDGPWHSGRS